MRYLVRTTVALFLASMVALFVVKVVMAPPTPIISYQGKISRSSALAIAPKFTQGKILQVMRINRFTTNYLIESRSDGSRITIPVGDGGTTDPGWQFCTNGDTVTFSVRDYPMGGFAKSDLVMNSVAYYLVPTCK